MSEPSHAVLTVEHTVAMPARLVRVKLPNANKLEQAVVVVDTERQTALLLNLMKLYQNPAGLTHGIEVDGPPPP